MHCLDAQRKDRLHLLSESRSSVQSLSLPEPAYTRPKISADPSLQSRRDVVDLRWRVALGARMKPRLNQAAVRTLLLGRFVSSRRSA